MGKRARIEGRMNEAKYRPEAQSLENAGEVAGQVSEHG